MLLQGTPNFPLNPLIIEGLQTGDFFLDFLFLSTGNITEMRLGLPGIISSSLVFLFVFLFVSQIDRQE